MKFTVERSELQNALNMAGRAVPAKSPIQSLEGFLIEAGSDLKITGYDLKKGIYTNLGADIRESGRMVVNARLFGDIIRKMPDGTVSVNCDSNNRITVKCGKIKYNMTGLDPENYPELTSFTGLNSAVLPQDVLKSMINQTLYAVSKDEARPIYTGSLFEIENDNLTMVSVDGFRLAKRVEKIESGLLDDCSFVVPAFALSDIEKFCGSEGTVEISVGEKNISFTIDNTVIISRRLEGDFINYKRTIPTDFRYELEIDRAELISVIERVALVLSERNGNPVKMTFNDNVIHCICNTTIGQAEDSCICDGSGEGLEIGFNDRYLTDALKAADDERLRLCLNTSSTPCIIKSVEDDDKFTFMVLPVRLHADR